MSDKYYRDLADLLRQSGCTYVRSGKGDHEIWHSPITDKHVVADRNCRRRHTANAILKQAGLPKSF